MAHSKLLTIANGAATSETLIFGTRSTISVMFIAPATLVETVNVRVYGKTNNALLRTAMEDVVLAADRADHAMIFNAEALRLELPSGTAAGARIFEILWALTGEIG